MKNLHYFRTIWSCGKYDKSTSSAIMYNLIAGYSFFFEDVSADVIGDILKCKRGEKIDINEIINKNNVDKDTLENFFDLLMQYGLVDTNPSNYDKVEKYRKLNIKQNNEPKLISEGTIENYKSDSEKAYIKRVNKKALTVMMELTYECSEQCIHCYNPGARRNSREKNNRKVKKALSLEQYKEIIDELVSLNTFKVCITGGDPFSSPYIWEILEYLYEKEIAFEIFTNGQGLIGKENRLADFFPLYVAVSIYSLNSLVHDGITRIPGSLDKSLKVLRNLHNKCVPLQIKCVIMKTNFENYRDVLNLSKELNANIQFDCRIFDAMDGDISVSKFLRLEEDQLEIALRDKLSLYYVGEEIPNYGAFKREKNEPACFAGWYNLCITPDGFIIPCCSYHASLGNLHENTLSKILNRANWDKVISLPINEYKECYRYEYCEFCILCPGLNFKEHGDPRFASENNCYYAKVRYNIYNKLKNNKNIDSHQKKSKEQMQDITKIKRIESRSYLNKEISF